MDYATFKAEMVDRGHEVHKKGNVIIIEPNNNYNGVAKGFMSDWEVVEDTELYKLLENGEARVIEFNHLNTWICKLRIKLL